MLVTWTSIARSVTNIKQTSGLDSLKRVIDLPGGGTAEAVDMGGTFRIYITTRSGKKVNTDSRESGAIPMLFSGAVTMARVKEGEGVGVRLTEQTRRRIAGYPTDPSAALPPKDGTLQRFRIEYPGRFAYFASAIGAEYMHTQFERLRPTWWSGAVSASPSGRRNLQRTRRCGAPRSSTSGAPPLHHLDRPARSMRTCRFTASGCSTSLA